MNGTWEAADAFWADCLGCSPESLRRPGYRLLINSALPYKRVTLFQHGRTTVTSAHPYLHDAVAAALGGVVGGACVGASDLAARLGAPAVAAPANVIAYLDPSEFKPFVDPNVRELTEADGNALGELNRACTARERELSEVSAAHPVAFGAFAGARLLAAASLRFDGARVADVGVVTHPDHRGRGHGRAAVSALCGWGLTRGRLVQYAALADNLASRRLAGGLGFRLYAVQEALLVG